MACEHIVHVKPNFDEIMTFANMTSTVKDVIEAIEANKHIDMHLNLYKVLMDICGFTEESLMVGLGYLINN
jgi:hypothetical protein